MNNASALLDGIRIVDLTRAMTGPFCTMMLGDMGADIIKIERPGSGDDTRKWGPPFKDGESIYFLSTNRNKRSITLNMKSEQGKEILWRLIDSADVLIENFRPGTMARLGFDYETVHTKKPNIIYASISGFGQEGPASDLTAYDLIVQGMSGMMSITGPPETPTKFGPPIADLVAGMFCANAINGALFYRERTGNGQYIDTSMLGSQVALLTYYAGMVTDADTNPTSSWNAHSILAPYQTFRTKDGHINVACGNDAIWRRFCEALGLKELATNLAYADNAGRKENLADLAPQIEARLTQLETMAVIQKLNDAGVPNGPIYTVEETLNHPQSQHYKLSQRIEHPTLGQIGQLGFPYTFSTTPCEIRLPPPTLGQHTTEILAEIGYSDGEISNFAEGQTV